MPVKQKHIFIVDDDQLPAEMLAAHLSENPFYTITRFNTGEECIRNLALDPDVIILDYNLNSQAHNAANGLEILQHIKKLDHAVNVIMLSSQDHYGKALESIVKGALEYIVKDNDAFAKIDHVLSSL